MGNLWQLPSDNAQRRVRVVVGLTDGSSGACRFTPPRRRNEKRGQASRQTTGKQHHHAKSYLHDNTYISIVMSYCRLSVLYNKSQYTIIYAPIIDFVFRSSLTAQPPSPATSWSFIALLRWHNLLSLKKRTRLGTSWNKPGRILVKNPSSPTRVGLKLIQKTMATDSLPNNRQKRSKISKCVYIQGSRSPSWRL